MAAAVTTTTTTTTDKKYRNAEIPHEEPFTNFYSSDRVFGGHWEWMLVVAIMESDVNWMIGRLADLHNSSEAPEVCTT